MSIIEELVYPLTFREFKQRYYHQEPFSAPQKAVSLKNAVNWLFLQEIFEKEHDNCWLPFQGTLPKEPELNTGLLTIDQALKGYNEGRTVLVRHAEKAHATYAAIAKDFYDSFKCPIDIQLYCTPQQQEGFNWHYDVEDVFVIQTTGEKEFRLRKNTVSPRPLDVKDYQGKYFVQETSKPELSCWLMAGDFLYIPAGYWHKARALTYSCHISVGVMENVFPIQTGHFY